MVLPECAYPVKHCSHPVKQCVTRSEQWFLFVFLWEWWEMSCGAAHGQEREREEKFDGKNKLPQGNKEMEKTQKENGENTPKLEVNITKEEHRGVFDIVMISKVVGPHNCVESRHFEVERQ